MEVGVLVLSILGLVFSLAGFAAATVAIITVKAWERSTHRISYASQEPVRYEVDVPPGVADQLPSSPEPTSVAQYVRRVQASNFEDLYDSL